MIPLSAPALGGKEWDYVKQCLDTGWVSSAGSFVERFEHDCTAAMGVSHAVACSSGTAALTLALRIAGAGQDDLVLMPTVTFIAPVNAAAYLGAVPMFFDCDDYYNLDISGIREYLDDQAERREDGSYERASGRRISAVVPVHVFGNAVDLDPLIDLAGEWFIPVIEDATESVGSVYTEGRYRGRMPGTIGAIGCLSFNGNKIITTGGGGMLLTDDAATDRRARYLSTQAKDDPVYFVHDDIGYNFRLTNIQSALGCAQLERIAVHKQSKQAHRAAYLEAVADIDGIEVAPVPTYADNNCWMTPIRVDERTFGLDRDGLLQRFGKADIEARPLWQLNHLQRPYRDCPHWTIERAPDLLASTVNLPCSVGLTEAERSQVIDVLRR